MAKGKRKKRLVDIIVAQAVDELEGEQIDAVIDAWRRGEMGTDQGKRIVARCLARCVVRTGGKAA